MAGRNKGRKEDLLFRKRRYCPGSPFPWWGAPALRVAQHGEMKKASPIRQQKGFSQVGAFAERPPTLTFPTKGRGPGQLPKEAKNPISFCYRSNMARKRRATCDGMTPSMHAWSLLPSASRRFRYRYEKRLDRSDQCAGRQHVVNGQRDPQSRFTLRSSGSFPQV